MFLKLKFLSNSKILSVSTEHCNYQSMRVSLGKKQPRRKEQTKRQLKVEDYMVYYVLEKCCDLV